MKTYAVVQTPTELRDKLVRYYTHKAERIEANIPGHSLKRDKDRSAHHARLLREIADELLKMEICSAPPSEMATGSFI